MACGVRVSLLWVFFMSNQPDQDSIFSFGLSARTGCPLREFSDAETDTAPQVEEPAPDLLKKLSLSGLRGDAFYVSGDFDASDLSQVGWGILFGPGVDPKIKDALRPLLTHREESSHVVIYDGEKAYLPGESATDWVERQGARMDIVNPEKGVPYYILIVASPEVIPFEFQYSLDIYWAVGRLWFDGVEQFRQYADSVIKYENMSTVQTHRDLAIFATEHDFDNATKLFTRKVIRPLTDGEGLKPLPIGKKEGFGLKAILGKDATKSALSDLLCGKLGGVPSLLFSGTHGMQFELDDPRQSAAQGAMVCQDWTRYGAINENDWFAASDVSARANLHGLIHILFACHGGGCSEFDNFDRKNEQPRRIASRPLVSSLPQKLLAHENGGALAVFAHVERAWTYSFQNSRGISQTQGFQDVIGKLLRGKRIGEATDGFNIRWSVLTNDLYEMQNKADAKAHWKMRIARNDARNFIVLGDPATHIRTEEARRDV
jgi:hypothetical protein